MRDVLYSDGCRGFVGGIRNIEGAASGLSGGPVHPEPQTQTEPASSPTKGIFTMCGIARLGAIGLVIGLMFMVSAPTDARAMTPISLFNINDPFPENVTGDAALPESGVFIAYNESSSPRFQAFTFENGNISVNTSGSGNNSATFGLIVAFSRQLGWQLWPVGGEDGGGGPVDGADGADGAAGPVDDGNVTHAPEPATWIMMIVGFWIVAWRLRHRAHNARGALAAPA